MNIENAFITAVNSFQQKEKYKICFLVNIYVTGLAYKDSLLQLTTFFFQCRELNFDFLSGKRHFYEVAVPEPL